MSYSEDCLFEPQPKRQQQLLTGWGFRCRCPRCEAEEGLPSGVQEQLLEVSGRQLQIAVECEWGGTYKPHSVCWLSSHAFTHVSLALHLP